MKNYQVVKLFDENMENLDEKIEQIVELRRQEALLRDGGEDSVDNGEQNEDITVGSA